jgi:PAS domain S-box-containing protein
MKKVKNGERRFEAIFDNAAVGIFLIDDKGHFFEVNKAFCDMLGFSEEHLLSMSCDDISHPNDKKLHIEFFKDLACGKTDKYTLEKRFIDSSADVVWVRVTFSAIRDNDEMFLYSIAVVENITPQKVMEEELEVALTVMMKDWDLEAESRRAERESLRQSISSLSQGF